MKAQIKKRMIGILKSRFTIIAASLLVMYTLAGFFLIPFLMGHFLPGMLSERFQSEVVLEDITINPYSLVIEARGFRVEEPSGERLAAFERLHVNFQLSSLFRWALTFRDVILDRAFLNIVIDKEGGLNLARLAGNEPQEQDADTQESKSPLRMVLFNVEINEADINLTDHRQPQSAKLSLSPLTVNFADISTIPEQGGNYSLTATGGDKTILNWTGSMTLHPFRSQGEIAFSHIPAEKPWSFFRSMLNIIPPQGDMDVETSYLIDLGGDTTIANLNDLRLQLKDLDFQLEQDEESFLALPRVNLEAEKIDITGRAVQDLRLGLSDGRLDISSDKDGVLNLQKIVRRGNGTETAEPSPETMPADEPWKVDISRVSLEGMSLGFRDESLTPARVLSTDDINLGFRAAVTMDSLQPGVQVDDLALALKGITLGFHGVDRPAVQVGTLSAEEGSLDLADRSATLSRLEVSDGVIDVIQDRDEPLNLARLVEPGGFVSGDTENEDSSEEKSSWDFLLHTLELKNFTAGLTDETVQKDNPVLDLKDISLRVSEFDGTSSFPFEAALRVDQGGAAQAKGRMDPSSVSLESTLEIENLALPVIQPYLARVADLTLKSGQLSSSGTFNRNNAGEMTYQGKARIAGLDVIENSTDATMLGWRQLQTPALNLGINPHGLEMDTLNISGLKGELIISEDKTVNVIDAFRSGEEPSEKAQNKEQAADRDGTVFPVAIDRINLDKGVLRFADFSLRPQFDTDIHELSGSITDVSSSPGTRSRVSLDGRVDQYGSNSIEGEINFFDPKEFTDISVIFENLEMTNLTPYSVKFAGRRIDRGRLSLDLEYLIQDSSLESHNKFVIETLLLGEKVESPDAVNLPLDLAIALLKDSRGIINVSLPVTGSLDDPDFSYSHVVWQAVRNLLGSIVTSPFRALGSLFGSEEEDLNEVLFKPGSAAVPPAEEEKLDTLLKALEERPLLKLVITGRYDPDADEQALKTRKFRRNFARATGIELEPDEEPMSIDFSNADTQEKLTEIFIEEYGRDHYEQVRAATEPSNGNQEDQDKEKETVDARELAQKLFAVLVERVALDSGALESLADQRAAAIVTYMTEAEKLDKERITTKPPQRIGEEEDISVTFKLESMEEDAQ
ncbi:MAG: DUF748 domain-containing protein [Desulfonatronovibrio sp.]